MHKDGEKEREKDKQITGNRRRTRTSKLQRKEEGPRQANDANREKKNDKDQQILGSGTRSGTRTSKLHKQKQGDGQGRAN